MTEWTTENLNTLLTHHLEAEIRETALELKACLANLDRETDSARQAALTDTAAGLVLVLEHALGEDGRGGEDYINDDVFHASG